MASKTFTVRFYAGTLVLPTEDEDDGAQAKYLSIPGILAEIAANPAFGLKDGGEMYFLRDIKIWNNNKNFSAVFGKLRMSDLPHISDDRGNEHELNLKVDEGLIEKNYLIYMGEKNLLIFQENSYAGRTSRLAQYLTAFAGLTVEFSPIIKADSMRRFMRGSVELRKFDLRVAKPTNPTMFPSDNFSAAMMQLLSSSQGATLGVHMSANLPGARGNSFGARMKPLLQKMVIGGHAKRAVVEVKEGNETFLIDLLADQISAKRDMQMVGRYPDPDKVFGELEKARQEVSSDLREHFGN
jgi:hypothetical protein